jgi:hypothetical protein
MARGHESLALEIRRRRAGGPAERQAVPDPPRAPSSARQAIAIAGALSVFLAAGAWYVTRYERCRT